MTPIYDMLLFAVDPGPFKTICIAIALIGTALQWWFFWRKKPGDDLPEEFHSLFNDDEETPNGDDDEDTGK